MRSLLSITAGLIITLCILGEASAQIRLRAWVMASGGGTCACPAYRTDCTVGEPMTGSTAGANGMQGAGFWGAVGTSPATSVTADNAPLAYTLEQNYPNPFNPSTMVRCTLPAAGHLKITVFDILGKEVAVLVDEMKEPGTILLRWDAAGLPSGVYFYRMTVAGYTETQKMVLLR